MSTFAVILYVLHQLGEAGKILTGETKRYDAPPIRTKVRGKRCRVLVAVEEE